MLRSAVPPSRLEELTTDTSFPQGLVVYYRLIGPQGVVSTIIKNARQVQLLDTGAGIDYSVTDTEGKFLGSIPRENVICILPLETVGPAADENQPK